MTRCNPSLVWYVDRYLTYRKQYRKPHPKSKFTPGEDSILRELVQEHGDDWNLIASEMPGRNARQCRERYIYYLSPTVNSSPWTPEEDAKLETLYREYGPKWVKISQFFDHRTEINVKSRWRVLHRQRHIIHTSRKKPRPVASSPSPEQNHSLALTFDPFDDFDADYWTLDGNQSLFDFDWQY